nr:hypothetical protein [Streptomyces tailanensis]
MIVCCPELHTDQPEKYPPRWPSTPPMGRPLPEGPKTESIVVGEAACHVEEFGSAGGPVVGHRRLVRCPAQYNSWLQGGQQAQRNRRVRRAGGSPPESV